MEHTDMTTLDVLRRLYVHGSDIGIDGDGIRLSGHPVPDELLAELKARKPDVLAVLTTQRLGELDTGFVSAVPRRYVVPASCLAPRACHRLGPCSRWLMRRPCNVFARSRTGKDGEAA
jgi:hypothetical protein